MRLFFAYWPSPSKAEAMAPWVQSAHALYGGRMMRTDTLHMTLAFLGQADEAATQHLVAACQEWTLPSGSMVLREPGRFLNAKVVWLGPAAAEPASLEWLYRANEQLWAQLAPLGWSPRETAFRPHVSLLRNAGPGPLEALQGPTVHWTPKRCVLVGSRPTQAGSRYTVLAEIPLANEPH
ncbi:MAG: RNA 2',3'-cyclic phosphodiesterase [Alcaligenaceae bacterium]|nr:RNA 2',3'-cyclic phosphodiesterase [Alcaligenaceae bacterium]